MRFQRDHLFFNKNLTIKTLIEWGRCIQFTWAKQVFVVGPLKNVILG